MSVWLLCVAFLGIVVDASLADALQLKSPLRTKSLLQKKLFPGLLKANDSTKICPTQSNSALFQSDAVASRISANVPKESLLEDRLSMLPGQILRGRNVVHKVCVSMTKGSLSFLKRWWWAFPMALALVPVYSTLVLNVLPSMPHWWPLTKMDQLLNSPSWGLIVTVFLSSNAFYFASGLYLLIRFSRKGNAMQGYNMLGGLVLTAGVVSTVFHYFQALGSFRVAEALCYLDHAVAITSILSFWHRCGRPGRVATTMSLVGVCTLAITDPLHIYPYLHSAWHGLSAGAAVFWAHDGVKRRLRILENGGVLVTV